MIKPKEILTYAWHHDDGIITQHVLPTSEDDAVNDIEVIILKFTGCQLRFEVKALLADVLQRVVPRLEGDERWSISSGVVNQLTSYANGKVKGGRLERRMAIHDAISRPATRVSISKNALSVGRHLKGSM